MHSNNAKIILWVTLLFLPSRIFAQPTTLLNDTSKTQLQPYAVLEDKGYDFNRILADSNLHFDENTSIFPGKVYWLKMNLKNPYAAPLAFTASIPSSLISIFYYYDYRSARWKTDTAGILTENDTRRVGRFSIEFGPKSETAAYVKMDLRASPPTGKSFKHVISFFPKALVDRHENQVFTAWLVGMTVLFIFFINNLYVYFSFRDKTILYYLVGQVGGMLYLTAYRWFFRLPFPNHAFSFLFTERLGYYDVNRIFLHLSIVLVLYGLVQLTRSYLNTRVTLPVADKVLRISIYGYIILTFILLAINLSGFFLENLTLLYDNIYCLLILATTLVVCLIAYFRKIPTAASFLAANLLALLVMVAIPLRHIFLSMDGEESIWLPELAIVSQALAFSIALVARTKSIQNDLKVREIEKQQLEFDLLELELKNKLAEQDNRLIQAEVQHQTTRAAFLQERLETNQRELASTTLYMIRKNELLADIKSQVQDLNKHEPDNPHDLPGGFSRGVPRGLKDIESLLNTDRYLDADWGKFKIHFEQVHPDFFEKLHADYPSLTQKEIRLFAYFHIKLTTKEIASLLNIDPGSVRRAKTRLYKKMRIPETEKPANEND